MEKDPLPRQQTAATLIPPADHPNASSEKLPVGEPESQHTTGRTYCGMHLHDILALIGIYIMLIWPWIFFGVVWAKKGIQMNNHVAEVITKNPHATTYFISLICSIISMITGFFFSLSIIRFAQELVSHRKPTEPFTLKVLLAFRHRNLPWGMQDIDYLRDKKRWWSALLLAFCVFVAFPQLISSTTSLLTPGPFNRTVTLNGTELDFSSTASDCLDFFAANPINNNCDWQFYQGLPYTNCLGENQMVDVLEAGRGPDSMDLGMRERRAGGPRNKYNLLH